MLCFDRVSKDLLFELRVHLGNCSEDPKKLINGHVVNRDELVEDIIKCFILDRSYGFGVILGPTGTGKTLAMKQACYNNRKGSLYYEIRGLDEFPRQLAESIGMRINRSLIGVFLGKYFPESFQGFYDLPSNYTEQIDYVIRSLGNRAASFKKRNGYPPCVFIDGADLLAKHNHEAFLRLVNLAKAYSNEGSLKIVLGCSEGHVIPLIYNSTSSNSRCFIMEILDIGYDKAMEYLVAHGVGEALACRLVTEIGSRMVFLERSVLYYHLFKTTYNEKEIFGKVMEELEAQFTRRAVDAVIKEMPRSMEVIEYLSKFETDIGFNPRVLYKMYKDKDKQTAYRETVKNLVNNNAFRYTRLGYITWHSKLIEKIVKNL